MLPEAEESDEAAAPAPEQRRLRGRAAAAYAAFVAVHGPPPPPPEEASADAVEEDERIVDELEIDEDERRELDRRQQQPGQRLLQMRRNFNPDNVRKSAKADDTFTKRQNHNKSFILWLYENSAYHYLLDDIIVLFHLFVQVVVVIRCDRYLLM